MGKRQRGFPDAPQPKRQRPLAPPPKHTRKNGKGGQGNQSKKRTAQQQQPSKPIIPFEKHDKILLIGEGDLSFAASLAKHHRCTNVTATVIERGHDELLEKYPHIDANIALFHGQSPNPVETSTLSSSAEATANNNNENPSGDTEERKGEELSEDEDPADIEHNADDDDDDDDDDANADPDLNPPRIKNNNKILYSVDVTKPPSYLSRPANRHHHIFFNFPHVGGKSTDVNRQVRHNQSLLVSFFKNLLPALLPGGSIIVTLFEGEPYTLWNIRDLARHCGLAVETSFRFDASWYPGYRHARTMGAIRKDGGKGEVVVSEEGGTNKGSGGGGWKGEQRAARSYVFRRDGEVPSQPLGKKWKKRGGGSDDDDDDDDDDSD